MKHVLYLIPILSPFIFILSLYSSFLKFVGFFINNYEVPLASAHHGNTKIHICTNFTCMVYKFEKQRSEKCLRPFFVHDGHGNTVYQVSPHVLYGMWV